MTSEDWTTFIFLACVLTLLVPSISSGILYSDLTNVYKHPDDKFRTKIQLTPTGARQVVWRYVWVATLCLIWPITFVGFVLFVVGWCVWQAIKIVALALQRS